MANCGTQLSVVLKNLGKLREGALAMASEVLGDKAKEFLDLSIKYQDAAIRLEVSQVCDCVTNECAPAHRASVVAQCDAFQLSITKALCAEVKCSL
jgi:hypothetical protein